MADDIQAILGELTGSCVIGATYTNIDTILSVQKQIQKLATLSPDYANCPTNKRTNTQIGPKFAKALATFNKQFGMASDGGSITDNTLAALKSSKVQNAINGIGAPPISRDTQALIDLANAQAEQKKAADAKAQAATPDDKAKAQAAVQAADTKVQSAATKVVSTTDDPATMKAAESAKAASKDAVNATTPQQAVAAAGKVTAVDQQVKDEVEANPEADRVVARGSLIDVLNKQYGPLPLWAWGLAGAGAVVIGSLLRGRPVAK